MEIKKGKKERKKGKINKEKLFGFFFHCKGKSKMAHMQLVTCTLALSSAVRKRKLFFNENLISVAECGFQL